MVLASSPRLLSLQESGKGRKCVYLAQNSSKSNEGGLVGIVLTGGTQCMGQLMEVSEGSLDLVFVRQWQLSESTKRLGALH